MLRTHFLVNLFIFACTIVLFIYFFTFIDNQTIPLPRAQLTSPQFKYFIEEQEHDQEQAEQEQEQEQAEEEHERELEEYNIWLIFTKVMEQSPLYYNFKRLIENILIISSVSINFHIVTDDGSKRIALDIFNKITSRFNATTILYEFYDLQTYAESIQDIVQAMTPFFSSRPGTYYSDALFYFSLGLHRLAPNRQKLAVMIDCDVYFKQDPLKLFHQFKQFRNGELFALAPELSPVYKHILYAYKLKHNTTFGEYLHEKPIKLQDRNTNHTWVSTIHPNGFPGYNSGVVLFNLTAIRQSQTYHLVINKESVEAMVKKYDFRGHLGDQDFYTLLGYEHPEMIRTLSCAFNRQLCTWWRDNGGYRDIFDKYFMCNQQIIVLHGNCNTKIAT